MAEEQGRARLGWTRVPHAGLCWGKLVCLGHRRWGRSFCEGMRGRQRECGKVGRWLGELMKEEIDLGTQWRGEGLGRVMWGERWVSKSQFLILWPSCAVSP